LEINLFESSLEIQLTCSVIGEPLKNCWS